MNILMLASLADGVGSRIRELVRMLIEHNVNLHVISLSYERNPSKDDKYTLVNGTGHSLLDLFHLGETAYNYALHNPVDLVHANFLMPPGYCALQLKQYLGISYVITLHGDDIHYICKTFSYKEQSKTILSNASKVITSSISLANEVKETLSICNKKLAVISNVVDIATFNPNIDGNIIRDKYKIYDPIILYAGRLWPNKGLHILLLAFKKLLDDHVKAKLMIVGDGSIMNELLQLTKRLKIDDNVLFSGSVLHSEIPLYMAACDVFVLPSIFEGQGIVALEAMSCAKPVVATTAGGIPEVVINGENGFLIDPYDIKGLGKTLKRLIENEDLRKELGLRGRKIMEKLYDPHDIINATICTYTDAFMTECKDLQNI